MNKSVVWGILLIIFLIIGGALISDNNTPSASPNSEDTIKIGVIAPLTGVVAEYGEEIRRGVTDGLTDGISAVFEDDKCSPKDAVSAFKKLADFQDIHFIIGPACGSPQEAVAPLLKNQPTIAIMPSAASSELYAQSGNNLYNIQYSLQDESKFVAQKMFELGYKRVALVSYANAFSQAHADSFRKNFAGEIALESQFADEATDVSTELSKISNARVDAIYSPDISFFFANGVQKLADRKIQLPIFSTYVTELPAARPFVPGVFYSFPNNLNGSEGAVYGLSRQATQLLSQAVKKCESKYDCVKKYLDESNQFGTNGISVRSFVLKQITSGGTEVLPR